MSGVRVGIIGAGFAANIHGRAFARLKDIDVKIVAVAAVPRAQAEAFACSYDIKDFYDDYREILKREDVDLVDLCVPNHLHHSFAIEAAEAGKHVICEKPLTGYFGDDTTEGLVGETPKAKMFEAALHNADEMLEAAERNGVKLMYAENWAYAPAIQKAARLVAASKGTVLEIRAQECHSGSHASYAKLWKFSGGGALIRLSPHPIGTAIYLKGQEGIRRNGKPITVRSVTAEVGDLTRIASYQKEPKKWLVTDWEDVENWATVILTFSDGSKGVFFASDIALGGMEDTLQIYLSNARVNCNLTHSNMVQAYAPDPTVFESEYIAEKLETKGGWSHPSIDEEWLLGYPQEIRDFVEAVAHDRQSLVDARLGREVVKVIYGAYVSAEEGRTVHLGE